MARVAIGCFVAITLFGVGGARGDEPPPPIRLAPAPAPSPRFDERTFTTGRRILIIGVAAMGVAAVGLAVATGLAVSEPDEYPPLWGAIPAGLQLLAGMWLAAYGQHLMQIAGPRGLAWSPIVVGLRDGAGVGARLVF